MANFRFLVVDMSTSSVPDLKSPASNSSGRSSAEFILLSSLLPHLGQSAAMLELAPSANAMAMDVM